MELISLLVDPQHTTTVSIYIFIFVFTTFFAFKANKRNKLHRETYRTKHRNYLFLISFFVAWFFYAFGNVGSDLETYLKIYSSATFSNGWIYGAGVETGYRVLNAILHNVIKNEYIGVSIIKSIQIILVFVSIWMLRDRIHIGYSVMAYMALFYFETFNLIRMSLAAGICMISVALLIKEKTIGSIVLALLAMSIHTSALIFFVVVIGCLIYQKSYQMKPLISMMVIVAVPVLVLFSGQLISLIIESGYFMDRYSNYTNTTSEVGVMQVVFYLPVFMSLYSLKRLRHDKQYRVLYDILFIFSICGFVVAMCGYMVGMLARAAVYFFVPFGVLLPFYIDCRCNNLAQVKRYFTLKTCKVFYTGYFIVRFILSTSGYYFVSKLYDYELIFGGMI